MHYLFQPHEGTLKIYVLQYNANTTEDYALAMVWRRVGLVSM